MFAYFIIRMFYRKHCLLGSLTEFFSSTLNLVFCKNKIVVEKCNFTGTYIVWILVSTQQLLDETVLNYNTKSKNNLKLDTATVTLIKTSEAGYKSEDVLINFLSDECYNVSMHVIN